jgi:hypothetical protein
MVRLLIVSGFLLLLAGLLLWLFPGIFRHFGRLPGDFHYQKENFSFYFPLTTGLIISIILTLLFRLTGK